MCKFCRYICCCFGGNNERKEEKKRQKQAARSRKLVTEISSHGHKWQKTIRVPEDLKTEDLTQYFRVPEDHKTVELAVESNGYRVDMGNQLGEGGFANVYKGCFIAKNFPVAVKIIEIPDEKDDKKKSTNMIDIKNELFVLQTARHPHIVTLLDHMVIKEKGKPDKMYVFMELATKGTVTHFLKESGGRVPEVKCQQIIAQTMSALLFMKAEGIAHRDLKLSNIFMNEINDVLIGDFGMSRVIYLKETHEIKLSQTFCGTPYYIAPELYRWRLMDKQKRKELEKDKRGYNAFGVDVWTLGVIAYKLLSGEYPYPGSGDTNKILKRMDRKKAKFTDTTIWNDTSKDFCMNCLEPIPEKRVILEDLAKHKWIKSDLNRVEDKVKQYLSQTKPQPITKSPTKVSDKTSQKSPTVTPKVDKSTAG